MLPDQLKRQELGIQTRALLQDDIHANSEKRPPNRKTDTQAQRAILKHHYNQVATCNMRLTNQKPIPR